jgi:hypothetical protein
MKESSKTEDKAKASGNSQVQLKPYKPRRRVEVVFVISTLPVVNSLKQ